MSAIWHVYACLSVWHVYQELVELTSSESRGCRGNGRNATEILGRSGFCWKLIGSGRVAKTHVAKLGHVPFNLMSRLLPGSSGCNGDPRAF